MQPTVTPVAVAPKSDAIVVVGTTAPAPVVSVGLDWAVLIPLIFGGIALLITTTVTALSTMRVKRTVEDNTVSGQKRDKKLDNITVLVNGRYSEVLQELADVKRLLAAESGLEVDKLKAELAQVKANEQASRVTQATSSKE